MDGTMHLDGVGHLSLPRIKSSVYDASRKVSDVEQETVELNDARLSATDLMQSMRQDAVVVRAFRLRFPDIDASNVHHCTSTYLKLEQQRCTDKQRTRDERDTEHGIEIATLLEATPTAGGTSVWSEVWSVSSVAEVRPFVGWRMFAVCKIHASPTVSRLVNVKGGGQLSVLTADGLLSMHVPPNALTQWDETACEFGVSMDTSVMEFEAEGGHVGPTSPIVECRPNGVCFNPESPVTISVPLLDFSTAMQRHPNSVPEVWVSDSINSEWHPLLDSNGCTVNATIQCTNDGRYLATFSTPHFSRFVVLFRNRVADALGVLSLYKYETATMSSYISKLMDMPGRDGRRSFLIRLDFEVNKADNEPRDEFRLLAPYSSRLRLPYGDIRVTINSDVIQPMPDQCLDFCDGHSGFVQFESQVPDTHHDMITPEMILASVTVSRWRRGIFRNNPIHLKKVHCNEEWESWFQQTVNTKVIADIIQREGSMNAFKRMCRSRLSLQSFDIETTIKSSTHDDSDFVGAIAKLFSEQGGTPEQFSTALVENLQSKRINSELYKDCDSSSSTTTSDSLMKAYPHTVVVHSRSYATDVLNDEATGPVSHSDYEKLMYHSIRVISNAQKASQEPSNSHDNSSKTPRGKKRLKGQGTITDAKSGGSPSGSPCPKVPVKQQLKYSSGMTASGHIRKNTCDEPTTEEIWKFDRSHPIGRHNAASQPQHPAQMPQKHQTRSYQTDRVYSRKPCHTPRTSTRPLQSQRTCSTQTHQIHKPQWHSARAPQIHQSASPGLPPVESLPLVEGLPHVEGINQTSKLVSSSNIDDLVVKLPPLEASMKDRLPIGNETDNIDEIITRDNSDEATQQEARENNQQGTGEIPSETTFVGNGENVMCGYNQQQVVNKVKIVNIKVKNVCNHQSRSSSSPQRSKSKAGSTRTRRQNRDR